MIIVRRKTRVVFMDASFNLPGGLCLPREIRRPVPKAEGLEELIRLRVPGAEILCFISAERRIGSSESPQPN